MVCPGNGCTAHGGDIDSCGILNSAFVLAGLAMMLNIRLSYSSAPYALIRFRLPENLFSVFVRRMASALELWCLPSMLLGNFIDLIQKGVFDNIISTKAAEKLRDAAGANANEQGKLRGLVQTLYERANALNTAVIDVASSDKKAAKVLKHKAGKTENDGLRGLAKDLYSKAKALEEAAGTVDNNAAKNLTTEVGTEGSGTKLANALKDLYGADDNNLTNKAQAVRTAYGNTGSGVKQKFDDVKSKAGTAYTGTKEPLYQAVVSAMNAFDNVYKPEEILKDAVGDQDKAPDESGEPKTLREALYELGNPGATDLPTKAKTVKDKFAGWGTGVKSLFQLVQAQVAAYEAGDTIKSTQYDTLKTAFDAFNNDYHDAISSDKFHITVIPSIIAQWLNFLTYVLLLIVYVMGGDTGHLTVFYFVIAISGVVFGINMTLVYAVDWQYITVYIAGENCFPALTSFIHYLTTLMFGNRRKWNSDFIVVCVDIVVAIIISFAAAVMWTLGYAVFKDGPGGTYGHIHAGGFTSDIYPDHMVSPFLMIVVGMGLVYAIYPGIAPGMIVPFYLIDKIEMVLLIATIFPPMIVVILQITDKNVSWGNPKHSPKAYGGWKTHSLRFWHLVDLLIVIKITLATIFIYSLHYKESSLSRTIINQPKMSTLLSITFYMCHEFLLAIGFAGQISNGPEYVLIPQYIGALFMIFLAFYSEGYIIEYKSHDPDHWPTDGTLYLNGYYQLNPDFFIMIKFNVCSDG